MVTGLLGVLGLAALGGVTSADTSSDTSTQAASSTSDDRDSAGEKSSRGLARAGTTGETEAQAQPKAAQKPAVKTEVQKAAEKKATEAKKATEKKAAEAKKAAAKTQAAAKAAGLDQKQADNAATIVKVTKSMGMNERAQIIALSTALQESNLYNLASGVIDESMKYPNQGVGWDHDSVGLFQQRPSSGWGSVKDLMDPNYQTKAFLSALKDVGDWQDLPVTIAAQTVQVSAFPDAYAKHQTRAEQIVTALR